MKRRIKHVVENQDRHLERVREFMAQPSVSQENQGMEECAELLLRYYQELGCKEAEIAETPVFPAVWAYYDAGAPKTLAVYSYFDTNVVGSGWDNPPYDAVVAPHGPFKKVLYGRGAGNKGAFMGFLNALESIKAAAGELPVNLMFVSEGEEFVGSDHIPLLIDRYRHHLSKADAAIVAGACQTASGRHFVVPGQQGKPAHRVGMLRRPVGEGTCGRARPFVGAARCRPPRLENGEGAGYPV